MPGPGWEVEAEAPAKLNLSLAVLGKRADGYHDLRTIFQAIDLRDRLRFRSRPEPGIALRVEGPEPVSAGPENLVVRAGEKLALRLGETRGAEILLEKHIPWGAGLGGGSSDAAAAILGLEALWGRSLPGEERRALALEVGSDVPFFLLGGTARGEGRGEILEPLPPPPTAAWVLILPDFRISTAEAFRALPPRLTSSEQQTKLQEAAVISGNFKVFVENVVNDLEVGVVRIQPRLARIKRDALRRGAAVVGLSGSGSAMFAVFKSQGTAEQLLEEDSFVQGVRVLSCHPVDIGARVVSA